MTRQAVAVDVAGRTRGTRRSPPSQAGVEHELSVRVLDTLLREDYANLRRHIRDRSAGHCLDLHCGPGLHVPLEPGGFLADLRVASDAGPLALGDVLAVLAAVCDPRDRDGVSAFTRECNEALAAMRLAQRHRPHVLGRLAALRRASRRTRGPRGLVWYDALAAGAGHPVYPAAQCRLGFSADDYLQYAPEHFPRFELAWVALPAAAVRRVGAEPATWWPEPVRVGLPARLAATHELMPVHPVSATAALRAALSDRGLLAGAHLAPEPYLRVIPTLSTRTMSVCDDPASHLKLPLPTSTLGLRNRRVITPGSLADGKLVQGILAAAARTDPLLDALLVTDEGTYGHAGHEYLGYLLRRYPPGLEDCDIVSVGALLAPLPGEALAIPKASGAAIGPLAPWAGADRGTRRRWSSRTWPAGGSAVISAACSMPTSARCSTLTCGCLPGMASRWRHTSKTPRFVVDGSGIRLLIKDFDGALIHLPRLAGALGPGAPAPAAFADPRMLTGSDHALADVFITIVVHLCAGAHRVRSG